MKNVYFFYNQYYDFDEKKVTIGGIQTYISNLIKICNQLGLRSTIVQCGRTEEYKSTEGFTIIQLVSSNIKEFENQVKQKLVPKVDIENDLFVFMTHTIIFNKLKFRNSIAVQHGISWDVPTNIRRNSIRAFLSRSIRSHKRIRDLEKVSKVVCVDYNFLNWVRTQVDYPVNNYSIIPNFTQIADQNIKSDEKVKIIFARRLYDYRGTRIFTKVIMRLLNEDEQIQVTIAGTGKDEQWMRENLEKYEDVQFISYKSEESLKIHADKHIAVVPTIGSEGTSLSLLEAMSAQCAVVCTNVGGMTNIIIDGYNGLMISPDEEELYQALKTVINDRDLRMYLAENAYETVIKGFSFEKWKGKWIEVITSFIN